MKIRELKEMIELDSALDISKLDYHSLDTAKLQVKYFNLYTDEYGKLRALELSLDKLKIDKFEYYKGNAPAEVYKEKPFDLTLTTAKANAYTECDPEVEAMKREIDIQKIKVDLITDMKQALNWRHVQIKNAIDFIKFKNGI